MENPFERFGIRHLSPSSLNLWNANPGLWALRYLGGLRDAMGPGAWRGSAVGVGFAEFLKSKDRGAALEAALNRFADEKPSEIDARAAKELENIEPMLDVLIADSASYKAPLKEAERKIEYPIDGLAVPVIGFIDLDFEGAPFIELKTTLRMPTSPKEDHVRQVALYRAAAKKPGAILYATPNKCATYPIGDNQAARALDELKRDAFSLQRFLSSCERPEEAITSLPMNTQDYRWSEAASAKLQEFAI